ncbi:hypothetical protein [Paracoccus tegillarcae]|uniref:Uncharacterized protein n=1 Tax=Paracoccus tegillarcae TaxID=1529068 RepID=A0A2K9EW86_9RHOB|nr:hypothetical protein [Paracoccus tegillarcae]AUH33544.1 hypothetical protein CUV01_09230 [Paracoccus tegillarcae]
MSVKLATAALLTALAPAAVMAETATLTVPLAGATIQNEEADMSVYFVDGEDGAVTVYAAYVTDDAPYAPNRLTMSLQNGDDVTFSLPGLPETNYSFARTGGIVTVTGEPVEPAIAANS